MFWIRCYCMCLLSLFVSDSIAGPESFIKPCKPDDTACLQSSAQAALPQIIHGIPELGIPSADPLYIKTITYDENNFKVVFSDAKIYGASNCKVDDVSRNLKNNIIHCAVECPIKGMGHYNMSGNILLFETCGDGDYIIETDNIKFIIDIKIKNIEKNGDVFWNVTGFDYNVEIIDKVNFYLQNLFGGNKEKAKIFEDALDKNWRVFVEEIGQPIYKQILFHYVQIIKKYFLATPSKYLEIV